MPEQLRQIYEFWLEMLDNETGSWLIITRGRPSVDPNALERVQVAFDVHVRLLEKPTAQIVIGPSWQRWENGDQLASCFDIQHFPLSLRWNGQKWRRADAPNCSKTLQRT
jgi:hypothetical protein